MGQPGSKYGSLEMKKTRSILFVCTANQCRSPMAEILMRDLLKRKDLTSLIDVKSAGTWAEPGYPATAHGVSVMAERGLDNRGHKSQSITIELLEEQDLVLTMESGHKEAIQIEFPDMASKVYLLSEMAGMTKNIDDPVGGSLEKYRDTSDEIEDWINRGFSKILQILSLPEEI